MHESLDEFKFRPDTDTNTRVICPCASEKLLYNCFYSSYTVTNIVMYEENDGNLKLALQFAKMILHIAREKLIPYECLRNVLQSLQICFTNRTNA